MPKMRIPRKKSLEDQINELDQYFVEEAMSASEDWLKSKVVQIAFTDEELEAAEKEDKDLAEKKTVYEAAKAQYDFAKESYTEPRTANKLKRKLIIRILKDRGKQ